MTALPFRQTIQSTAPLNITQQQKIAQLTRSQQHDWLTLHNQCIMARLCQPLAAEERQAVAHYCGQQRLDHAYLPSQTKLEDFRLLVMDMDSTLITIECLDEIADFCGRKAEVATATAALMNNPNADFKTALKNRLIWLNGLDQTALERVYTERLRLSPGAEILLHAAQQQRIKTLLVSGGFTFFTDKLKNRLNLDFAYANTLEIQQGKLTGKVIGDIIDGTVKAQIVEKICSELQISPKQAIVIGDGSNDLKMMALAGLSVAYRAKPVVRTQTDIALDCVGLDGLLPLLDIPRISTHSA